MVMILLASLGFASLWLAVVADVGSMLLVCINGMRLLVYASDEDATDKCSKCFNESAVDGGCGCADPKPVADIHVPSLQQERCGTCHDDIRCPADNSTTDDQHNLHDCLKVKQLAKQQPWRD
eukprot:COSAG02_NODE_24779_length_678_cov_0.639033_1_plen_121_part_01